MKKSSKVVLTICIVALIVSLMTLAILEGGGIKDVMIIFVILVPVMLGCGIGLILLKTMEKRKGKKATFNEIQFYLGIPMIIFMWISISLFMQ